MFLLKKSKVIFIKNFKLKLKTYLSIYLRGEIHLDKQTCPPFFMEQFRTKQ